MKGRLFLILFALPFAGVGVWAGYSIASNLLDAYEMRRWAEVRAELLDAGYTSHAGDDSTTYKAYAEYRYEVGGQTYIGTRVGIAGGADNIGDYQISMGRRLEQARQRGEPVVVYYDPNAPAESIVDRKIRWGMIGFKSIFLLVFGGFGVGLIVWSLRAPQEKNPDDPAYADAPWLANDDWQTPSIRSSSRAAMYAAWVFAAIWNLISAPLPFLIVEEVRSKENYLALIGLLFPLVGVGFLVWAIRRTREWTRFGTAPVELDPFPGAIGGHVGGTINLSLPYNPTARFEVVLTSLHSYVSGSGKNRSRKEKAIWQDDLVAVAEPGPAGTRITFRFNVPDGLEESDAQSQGDSSYAWRLNVKADIPGADFDRDYEIPVYATGSHSARLPEPAVARAESLNDAGDEARVLAQLNLDHDMHGRRAHFPAGRNLSIAFGGVIVGAMFAGAGYFIAAREGEWLFGAIFGGLGALLIAGMLYAALNSLTVVSAGGTLTSVRRVLGLTVWSRSMRVRDIVRISRDSSFQTQSGGRYVMHYSIFAEDVGGQKMKLGEGFRGDSDAAAAIRILAREFGLRSVEENHAAEARDDIDVLAADG